MIGFQLHFDNPYLPDRQTETVKQMVPFKYTPLPPLEPRKEVAYVIVYFDKMAEKQIWKDAFYREEAAEECAKGLGLVGKHIYNIVKVELR